MTTVASALTGISRLGIDTAPLIYFVEAHPRYDGIVTAIFSQIDAGTVSGVNSVITLGEVLVQPIARQNTRLEAEYRDLLLNSAYFELVPITSQIAERAATIRANHRLRLPDALQLAAAIASRCDAFLTNDADLQRVSEIRVVYLGDLES